MAQAPKRKVMAGGNWKCNGTSASLGKLCADLAKVNTDGIDVVVSPTPIYLGQVRDALKDSKIEVSSQNVSATKQGAYTGEIAADQLVDFGLKWTIIGHSERRSYYGDTDDVVKTKCAIALENGLKIIACLGETQQERDGGKVKEVCLRQLKAICEGVGKNNMAEKVVIAYEPVWAIGTGNTCSPKDAQDACNMLRTYLKDNVSAEAAEGTRILYGGSVKPSNSDELIKQPDIDGFLVGGASLKAESFGPIIASCQKA
jgi:triosephosphate isomerase